VVLVASTVAASLFSNSHLSKNQTSSLLYRLYQYNALRLEIHVLSSWDMWKDDAARERNGKGGDIGKRQE